MRITFYTPLSKASAIARTAITIADELQRRGHRVTLIRSERVKDTEAASYETRLPVRWWQDVVAGEIAQDSDIVLLNIGDNYGFHAGIFSILDVVPCLGIFHDFFLYSLFREWALTSDQDRFDLHNAEIMRIYGINAPDAAKLAEDELDLGEIAEHFPMTEWLAARCGGVVTHSTFYGHRAEAACAGPVSVIPLSYEPRDVPPLALHEGPLVNVLTVGHVNPNKCCEQIIRALAASAGEREVRYCIAGPVTAGERERLEEIAKEVGFERLDILGAVSDDVLEEELDNADIICCLRRPVLEGASASAIEAMMAGRPVVVANAGFYADLPDDLVFKVSAEVRAEELAAVLGRLLADEGLRREIGIKVKDYALREFRCDRYVDKLEVAIDQVIEVRPYAGVSVRMAQELSALGLSADDPLTGRIARAMEHLFTTP